MVAVVSVGVNMRIVMIVVMDVALGGGLVSDVADELLG